MKTGKKLVPCDCMCHKDSNMIHITACCKNGMKEEIELSFEDRHAFFGKWAIFTDEEIKFLKENNIKFTEEYKRGVHETWGGRAIIVYDILYRLLNDK
jgi:hypothetical protein